jgi:hypothetical protein
VTWVTLATVFGLLEIDELCLTIESAWVIGSGGWRSPH